MIADFLEKMGKLEILTYVGVDDFADKLNFLFSVWLLILFCSITTVKTYFLTPITCYIPNIAGSHEGQASYITNYCYTEGTYNVPLEDFKIENEDLNWMDKYESKKIYYYQWLPFMLGLQGIMCYIPRIVWYLFANNRTGSDLTQLVKLANDAIKAEGDKRDKLIAHITKHMELWINNTREYKQNFKVRLRNSIHRRLSVCLPSKRLGTWLVFIYFIIKLLYIANNVGQLYMMHRFLQLDSSNYTYIYGFQLMRDLVNGKDWKNTGVFPRSGCCAIKTRQASYAQYIFAQCSLPVNMINEKIFLFLWFWFLFVLLMTILSSFIWLCRLITRRNRKQLVKKYLYLAGVEMSEDEKRTAGKFVSQFLRHDGSFLLHMMALNCGDVITTDICVAIYKTYKEKYSDRDFRGVACKDDCTYNLNESPLCTKKQRQKLNSFTKEVNNTLGSALGLTKRQTSVTPSAPPAEDTTHNSTLNASLLHPDNDDSPA